MMKRMNGNEQKTFEMLVSLTQTGLKNVLSKFVREKYGNKNVIETKDYICVQGKIPVALVAHMDTVFDKPVQDVFYDQSKNVMWSPQGIGADDRAGIFAILKIVNSGLRPHLIFTTDEEKGCLGADELSKLSCPFEDLRYCIQLDRRGTNDCVFYDCDNEEFVSYVEDFGFIEAYGSFSDICEICPAWEVAGVNLSVGYVNEHSFQELFYVSPFLATVEKVKKMLTAEEIPYFRYVPNPLSLKYGNYYRHLNSYDSLYVGGWGTKDSYVDKYYDTSGKVNSNAYQLNHLCYVCNRDFPEVEMFPVKMKDDSTDWVCVDCCVDNVGWCDNCNEPYELGPKDTILNMCPDCRTLMQNIINKNKKNKQ